MLESSSRQTLGSFPAILRIEKNWGFGLEVPRALILLAQVVPLDILPEPLRHLRWGNLLSLPTAQNCG